MAEIIDNTEQGRQLKELRNFVHDSEIWNAYLAEELLKIQGNRDAHSDPAEFFSAGEQKYTVEEARNTVNTINAQISMIESMNSSHASSDQETEIGLLLMNAREKVKITELLLRRINEAQDVVDNRLNLSNMIKFVTRRFQR